MLNRILEVPGIYLYIGILSILLCWSIKVHYGLFKQIRTPKETLYATLISKKIVYRVNTTSPASLGIRPGYILTFKLESGEEKVFWVKIDQYAIILEENYGKLTFKGNCYVGFEIEKIRQDL